ncbi:MAG: BtrH N-terminal domain-containing protein [Neisseriaceae bacterium]|nr:BtrH N-terminal domain-containing protein [Neisseriaceae bacterium]
MQNIQLDFPHIHAAHCESGAAAALLQHGGLAFDEPLAFGLGCGLTYAFIPLVKMAGMPLISYRMPPGAILKRLQKVLNISFVRQRFRQPEQGMQALNNALLNGTPVGVQTSIYWLRYFPDSFRFHFNAHNLVVYGYENNDYLISDPILDKPQRCPVADLQKARFAKGALAPKGAMYYLKSKLPTLDDLNLAKLTQDALRQGAKQMLAPVFFIGYRGIHRVANSVAALPNQNKSEKYRKLYLGNLVRMQEEIGTGGAGFRYLYAAFLDRVGGLLNNSDIQGFSQQLTEIGDNWRQFAAVCVSLCKTENLSQYAEVANHLHQIADSEKAFWQEIKHFSGSLK